MKLVNLKYTAAEKKDEQSEMAVSSTSDYPYGLCITLEDEELAKLKMAMPNVGDKINFACVGEVTSCSIQRRSGQDDESRVSIQITQMAVMTPADVAEEKAEGKKKTPTLLNKYGA